MSMTTALTCSLCLSVAPLAPEETQDPGAVGGQGVEYRELAGTQPQTVAEASEFSRSSTLDEVVAFLDALEGLPAASRLERRVIGQTTEGRDLIAVTVSDDRPADETLPPRLPVVINANIHGGEIEGKVAAQILLRELAQGGHGDILEAFDLTFIPVFNADGNDRISRENRVTQNGPDGGVGERANAMSLDLNRDFVKLESPEVRALTRLVVELDPAVFFDLHTTNGSPHGYDLTYASSLSPNAHPACATYARDRLFPAVRSDLLTSQGIHVFDYGNFSYGPREPGSKGERGDPVAWSTYDSRPRFGTNLMGLRGTISILSEAYSYLDYRRRVEVTHAFVLASLRKLASDHGELYKIYRATRAGTSPQTVSLQVDAALIAGEQEPVRVGGWTEVDVPVRGDEAPVSGKRRVASPPGDARVVTMTVRRGFEGRRSVSAGPVFFVMEPSQEVAEVLSIHMGREPVRLAADEAFLVRRFVVRSSKRATRPFQGHREVSWVGDWETAKIVVPAGTLVIPNSPLMMQLLHPESEDSLGTWNAFDGAIGEIPGAGAESDEAAASPNGIHPVLEWVPNAGVNPLVPR